MKKIIISLLLTVSLYGAVTHSAKVLEHVHSGGYTYIKVMEGISIYWIATIHKEVKKGELITFDEQVWMRNFYSKTLNKSFDRILFASDQMAKTDKKSFNKMNKADNFVSEYSHNGANAIAEIIKNKDKYDKKEITIKAKVTKVLRGIMGRVWIHLEDGTSYNQIPEIVATTKDKKNIPEVGDIVLAKGIVAKDKDFGAGYFYPAIVEGTTFVKY